MRLPFSLYFVLLKFQKGCLFIQSACIACQTAVCSDNSVTGNYYRDGIMSNGTSDCLSRHTLSSLLLCEDTGYLSVGHSLSVRYCQHDIAYCLSEWRCVQTYRRSEIRLFSAKINIEPVAGLRKYRQLCFVAFRYELMGKVFLPVEP